ncbi:MAG TPA: IS1182 family transposase [Armatimonadota bacterium]|nr:IS1182 family transposase [Armatimonadota bacterium]
MKKFRDYDQNQILLFPPSVQDWIPDDHPAKYIDEVVENLDLSAIYDSYTESRGYPPYSPIMMVKILMYAVSKGIHSSRKIEKALHDDIGFRYLSANQQPDHWTISEFRRRHMEALGDIFVQSVQVAQKSGLVKLEQIAIDGTKIKANASKHSAMSYARMKKEEERLDRMIREYLEEADRIDREEDALYGRGNGWSLPEELSTAEKRREAIRKALAELEAEAREKAEKEQAEKKEKAKKQGKKHNPRKKTSEATPKDKAQRNFTDMESRIMRNSDKAFIQGYNGQIAVDADTQIIVAADISNQAADTVHLTDIVRQVIENTGQVIKEVSADAGYYSEENLKFLERENIEAFIPPDKVKHSEWREARAPRGRIPGNADRRYLMRRKLKTKRGRARYKLRQISVEPVFGFVKEQLNLRQFLLRGLEKVRNYWRFTCAVANFMKIYRLEWGR